MGDRASAERACKDPNPIIDGRKANVNLAILGAKPRGNLTPGKHLMFYFFPNVWLEVFSNIVKKKICMNFQWQKRKFHKTVIFYINDHRIVLLTISAKYL